jgi:hypothetical protein
MPPGYSFKASLFDFIPDIHYCFGTASFLKVLSNQIGSEPLHTKMNPTSCLFGSRFVDLQAVFLSVSNISLSSSMLQAILYFCLDYVILWPSSGRTLQAGSYFGIFKTFPSRAVIQRTIVGFFLFLEHGLVEKIKFCAHTILLPNK